jgi:cytochrome c-type biogenesis protein CcmE
MKCFADDGKDCRVLKAKKCIGCSFFATPKQVEKARRASYDRRVRLGGIFTFYDKKYQPRGKS